MLLLYCFVLFHHKNLSDRFPITISLNIHIPILLLTWPCINILFRNKVDLTKYIEEHNFNFDNVFDFQSDNQEVCICYFKFRKNKQSQILLYKIFAYLVFFGIQILYTLMQYLKLNIYLYTFLYRYIKFVCNLWLSAHFREPKQRALPMVKLALVRPSLWWALQTDQTLVSTSLLLMISANYYNHILSYHCTCPSMKYTAGNYMICWIIVN